MTIIMDKLEPPQMEELLQRHFPVAKASLAGKLLDYLFYVGDDAFAIERKSVHDLAGRVDDLEKQLKTAMATAKYITLIVEGVMKPIDGGKDTLLYKEKQDGNVFYSCRTAGRPYSYYMGFIYRLADAGIPTIWTANLEGTAEAIAEIVKLASKTEPSGLFQRIIRTKNSIASVNPQVQEMVNMGLGEQAATLLIQKYGTVWNVIHAPEQELLSIPKIGNKTVEKLWRLLGKS